MYELINTSVPNGLIAGTHGFATVAMTKGMPDAIRQRVENFCAYPHRTSAHDASYFTENPVNWFHLMLPGGDHVVGRTAPAEFDYTGRTNRISHTLHFSSREMPISGGAYILATESSRFCEGWHGEPRYLSVDKSTAGRLQLDNRPSGTEPTHWIQMFGADGKAYAQKFAALLEQNMRTSKGIYFKASKADNDGKRLLGLFADLINILPDELAAQVTFSTFAACVPNGVVCHLRGIYDKDRAFETASSLQPWVDCENCCVKHPEMLPLLIEKKSILTTDTRTSSAGEKASSARPDLRMRRDRTDAREYPRGVRRSYRPQSKPSHTARYVLAGMSLVAILIGTVGLYVYEPWKNRSGADGGNSIGQDQQNKLNEWYCVRTNEIAKCQIEVGECETSSAAMRLLELVKGKRRSLQSSLEAEGLANYHTRLHEVEVKYDALIAGLSSKLSILKQKDAERTAQHAAEEKKRKDDEENRKKIASDAKAKEAVATLARKQAAEDKRNEEVQKLATRSLKELSITEVLSSSKTWVDKISDNVKNKLTAEGSIIYFFLADGSIKKTTGCVKAMVKKDPRSHKETRTLTVESPEAKSSKWFVVHIPSIQKVYWQWRTEAAKLFAEEDAVNLCLYVFGGKNDAHKLYQGKQEIIYVVSWKVNDNHYRYFTSKDYLSMNDIRYSKNFESEIKKHEREILKCQQRIDQLNDFMRNVDDWRSKMKAAIEKYTQLKNQRQSADKEKQKDLDTQMEKQEIEAYDIFMHFDKFKQYKKTINNTVKDGNRNKQVPCNAINLGAIKGQDCDDAANRTRDKARVEITTKEGKISEKKKAIEKINRKLSNWKRECRDCMYKVEVIADSISDEMKLDTVLPLDGAGEE